jgi:hypothetical protein
MARRTSGTDLPVLRRLVPVAARMVTVVRVYTAVTAGAVVVVAGVLAWRFWPSSVVEGAALFVLVALLAAPVLCLWLFGTALAEVVELPDKVGSVPSAARGHGAELAELVAESRKRDDHERLRSIPGDAWRAGRLLLAVRSDIPGYGAVLTLVSPPFLVASAASAAIAAWIIVLALPIVAVAVLTAAL